MPEGVATQVETYDPSTFKAVAGSRSVGRTPVDLQARARIVSVHVWGVPGHHGFRYPVLLDAGETIDVSVRIPPALAVPEGFVFVPAGRFLFGSANEEMRTGFLETVPLHTVSTRRIPDLSSRNDCERVDRLSGGTSSRPTGAAPPSRICRRRPVDSCSSGRRNQEMGGSSCSDRPTHSTPRRKTSL